MNKLFTKITSLALGAAMMIGVGVATISTPNHVGKVSAADATITPGTNGSACKVNSKDGVKVGTSSKGGDLTVTVGAGATTLTVYAAAWKGVNGLSLNLSGATTNPTSISLTADSGVSNNSPFTLSGNEENYKFDIALSNITAETKIKFTTSTTKRFVLWNATYDTSSPTHTHTWVAGTVHAPTCTEEGYTEYTCSRCSDTKHDDVVPATGHNYVDGVCTVCGAKQPRYMVVLPTDGEAVEGGSTGLPFSLSKYCLNIDATGTLTSTEARVFKGKSLSISGILIKKVVITCTAKGTTKQGPGCWGSGAPEGYTFESDGYTGTWEGTPTDSLTFTAADNQVRITQFEIYITAEGFASLLSSKITCNVEGGSEPTYITGYSWSMLETIYNYLDADETTILKNASYTKSGSGSSTEIEPTSGTTQSVADAVAKYDYIVGKYNPTLSSTSAYKDFIGRSPEPIVSGRIVLNPFGLSEGNPTAIIVIVSVIGVSALGGFFFLRKRKEI